MRARSYNGPTNGLLIRPVPGALTSPYGYRIHPIYHYWGLHDGDDFGVACGEGMKAVAGGTVVAKYFSTVYGNRLYLSLGNVNGKNLTAVYNHASRYRYDVGRPRRPGRRGRLRRDDRLDDRLPPALHAPGQRHRRRPDEVAPVGLVEEGALRPSRNPLPYLRESSGG